MSTTAPKPKTIYRTPERLAIVARDWPSDIPVADILAALNATPGPKPVVIGHIRKWAARAHIARDPDASRAQRRASGIASHDTPPRPAVDRNPDLDVSAALRRIAKPGWEFEKLMALVDYWREGVGTKEIGRRIDITKNAVVGKAHWLIAMGLIEPRGNPVTYGMEPRPPKIPPPPRVVVPPLPSAYQKPRAGQALPSSAVTIPIIVPRPVFAYVPPRHVPPPRPVPVPVFSREAIGNGKCQMPLWSNRERPTHKYCDMPAILGTSWCPKCRGVVFTRGGVAADREAA